MKRRMLLIAALAGRAALASDEIPPPPQREPLLVVNAVLHPVSGPVIEGGRMLVEGGRIRAIAKPGEPLAAPAGTRTLDLGGRHVYPGFIAANGALGLTEVGSVPATNDGSESGAINPNARAVVAVNPDSELLPVARSNGILAALAAPGGRGRGAIAGTAAVIQLDGWTWEQMALEREAALMVELPSMRLNPALFEPPLDALLPEIRKASEQRLREIDEAFDAARAWGRARAADPRTPGDLRWQALQPALAGQRPVFVVANELAQIRWALSLAERQGLKIVIVGGADAGRIADVLAARRVPVVIGGVHRLPLRRDDDVDAPFRLAAELARAGVAFCIAREGGSFAAANERNLPYEAATAAAYGLPRDEALKAITLYPARILGVADRLGSLEPGKLASFIVTDGDPLETPTRIERVFVQGREVDASNRQQRLVRKYEEKYRQLGGPR